MQTRKEFSILKWIVFPAISLVLSGAIAYFNLRVFGYEDGLPYAVIVLMIGVFSVVINAYTESRNRKLAIAAFVFEIFLAAVLIGNAAYSLSVQRKMAVARMADHEQTQTIGEISKLRGARTQREALKKIDKSESAQTAFAQYEDTLFWIMVGELALFGVCAFTLFGIAKLIDSPELTEREKEIQRAVLATRTPYHVRSEEEIKAEYDRQAAIYDQQREEEAEREQWRLIADRRRQYGEQLHAKYADEPLNSLPLPRVGIKRHRDFNGLEDENAEQRTPASRADLSTRPLSPTEKKDTRKTHVSFDFLHYSEGLAALRESLREIAFYHPGLSFKADLKPDGVWIRAMRAREGTQETVNSVKASLTLLDDALGMSADGFRARLEKFLVRAGFKLSTPRAEEREGKGTDNGL